MLSSQAGNVSEKPLFRFLQWNDVHVDETEPPAYQLANDKMKYLVDWANNEGTVRPDLVVGVGDMVHGGQLADLAPDTHLQKKLLADLKVPFCPVTWTWWTSMRTRLWPFCRATCT